MEALFTSTVTVALAEMGDKTQLLTLLLASRFLSRKALIGGIAAATILNHGISAWLGSYLGALIPTNIANYVVGISFVVVGLWLLVPDKDEAATGRFDHFGAFCATFILFSLAEIGDKTQVATVLLGAEYHSVLWVTVGTTVGMLLANVPVIYLGEKLLCRLPVRWVQLIAAGLFVAMGIATMWWG